MLCNWRATEAPQQRQSVSKTACPSWIWVARSILRLSARLWPILAGPAVESNVMRPGTQRWMGDCESALNIGSGSRWRTTGCSKRRRQGWPVGWRRRWHVHRADLAARAGAADRRRAQPRTPDRCRSPSRHWLGPGFALHQLSPRAQPQPLVEPPGHAAPVLPAGQHLRPERARRHRPGRHAGTTLGRQDRRPRDLPRSDPF